jgi:hypothetical protein
MQTSLADTAQRHMHQNIFRRKQPEHRRKLEGTPYRHPNSETGVL